MHEVDLDITRTKQKSSPIFEVSMVVISMDVVFETNTAFIKIP